MLADYVAFARSYRRSLGFAFILAALSSFGQTFFIALSAAGMREELHLSEGALGSAYAAATLAAGVMLGWVGRYIDRVNLRTYTICVGVLLSVACAVTALAWNLVALVGAFWLLRLGGQGLMTHISMTATARRFPQDSGKALGLVALGFAAGEAVLPPFTVLLAPLVGWRGVWWVAVLAIAVGMFLALRLLPEQRTAPGAKGGGGRRDILRDGVAHAPLWKDRRLHLVMPAALAPSFVMTGFFFHQVSLAAEMGWSLAVIAGAFAGFAVVRASTMLGVGPVIDGLGAARLLPFFLLPLTLAVIVIALGGFGTVGAIAYLAASGVTAGVSTTLTTSLWTEYFGVERLGAVRAAVAGAGVIASALAPAIFGLLLDYGVTLQLQALGCCAWLILASVLTVPLARVKTIRG